MTYKRYLKIGRICFTVMLTDGFNACLLFTRPKKDKSSKIKLELEDFNENEVEKYLQSITLDLGREHVFTSVTND